LTHPLSSAALSLDTYRNGRWIVYDHETTNKDNGSALNPYNRIVCTSWKLRGGKVQHHYGNLLECKAFWDAYEQADYAIAFNAKFEAKWLIRLGVDPTLKLWADPMIAEKVRLGNRFGLLNLGDVAQRYGLQGKDDVIDTMMKSGICPSEMPERRLIARNRRDVVTTEAIWEQQLRRLGKTQQLQVVLTRCLLTPILADIERNGICLDKPRVVEEHTAYVDALREVERKLDDFTGGINMRSPKQKIGFLYGLAEVPTTAADDGHIEGKTYKWVKDSKVKSLKFKEPVDQRGRVKRNRSKRYPQGQPKTDKNTMLWLESQGTTEKQKQWLAMRQDFGRLDAAVTKNLNFFRGVVEERKQPVFYGVFNQVNTGTHRLSSSGIPQTFAMFPGKEPSVQFQNMPRGFKKLFTVRDSDYVYVEADGSQLEFVVAAFLGQDSVAIANIRDPLFDAHIQTAAVMQDPEFAGDINRELYLDLLRRKKEGDPRVKAFRQDSKPRTFKPLYGGTQGTELEMRYYAWFQQNYSELYAQQEEWVNEVMATGRLITPWGMRFYWDFYLNANGQPMDRREHTSIVPAVFNYPVQSLATAEIIPIALVFLYHRVNKAGLRVMFVNTVHDSVNAEVHKDDVEKYIALVKQAFTFDVYDYLLKVYKLKFNVPLGCEVVYGTHWGEGKEVKFKEEPPSYKEAA
jgi:DNA polymerase I-like protein with 3'-5' exonuclease and polymerase domains